MIVWEVWVVVNQLERKGLLALLRECLGIREREELLIVYDESTDDYAKELARLALELGPTLTLLFVPQEQQRRIVESCAPDGYPKPVSYTHLTLPTSDLV